MDSITTASTPQDRVLMKLKQRWTYEGRKPTTLRWDAGPWGGWLLMKFPDAPRVVIEEAGPLLSSAEALQALFPGQTHNPRCITTKGWEFHFPDGAAKMNPRYCLVDKWKQVQLPVGEEYLTLRRELTGEQP